MGPAATASEVGWLFVPQFYTFVNKDPEKLHCFYTKRSTLIHGTEGEESSACYGQQEIHKKIMSLGFDDCKVFVSNVDSQSSAEGGIIVQVLGEMSNRGGPWRKFAQTFFLAEQPNGYFVLNDIFRYIKEENDEEDEPQSETDSIDAVPTEAAESANLEVSMQETHISQEPAPVPPPEVPPPEPIEPTQPSAPTASQSSPLASAPSASLQPEPPYANGINGDTGAVSEAHLETALEDRPPSPVPEPAPVEVSAPESPHLAAQVPPSPQPAVPAAPATASSWNEPPATKASEPAAPTAPTPKTWASLAARNSTKWGSQVADSRAVSSAGAPSTPERPPTTTATSMSPRQNGFGSGGGNSSAHCFIKGVVEGVSNAALKDTLVRRFGTVKEMDVVRSKACAFVEFFNIESARRAIQASATEGGIPVGEEGLVVNIDEKRKPVERSGGERGGWVPRGGGFRGGMTRGTGSDGGGRGRGTDGSRGFRGRR